MSSEDTRLKLVIKASRIPSRATVTKPSGHAEYLLMREIRFFPQGKGAGERKSVKPEHGCVFLVREEGGDVSVYPPHTLLGWLVEPEELRTYLDEMLKGTSK